MKDDCESTNKRVRGKESLNKRSVMCWTYTGNRKVNGHLEISMKKLKYEFGTHTREAVDKMEDWFEKKYKLHDKGYDFETT